MSAASVIACRSPTILRNCSTSSGASGGVADLLMFMSSLSFRFSARHRSPAQPVVDRLAQALFGDRHHRDRPWAFRIEGAKIAEQVGGGFIEISRGRQIHDD